MATVVPECAPSIRSKLATSAWKLWATAYANGAFRGRYVDLLVLLCDFDHAAMNQASCGHTARFNQGSPGFSGDGLGRLRWADAALNGLLLEQVDNGRLELDIDRLNPMGTARLGAVLYRFPIVGPTLAKFHHTSAPQAVFGLQRTTACCAFWEANHRPCDRAASRNRSSKASSVGSIGLEYPPPMNTTHPTLF